MSENGFGAPSVALSIAMLACCGLLIVYLFGVVGREVHGDAVVGYAYAWFISLGWTVAIWLCVGGLLLIASRQGELSNALAITMFFTSAAAAASALFLIQDPRRIWPAFLLVLIPLLTSFYLFALSRSWMKPAAGIAIVVLSAAPVISAAGALVSDFAGRRDRARDMADWEIHQRANRRAENLEKIKAMPADARLMDWYDLLDEESGVRPEALEALRRIDRRQSDIEDMLPYGILRAMMLVPEFDLKPTPQLCEAAKAFLRKHAANRRSTDASPYDDAGDTDKILPALKWLKSNRCDCSAEIGAVQDAIKSYGDSPDRKRALAALDAVK